MIFERGLKNTLEIYKKWWAGELDRPIIPIVLTYDETGKKPRNPYEGQKSFGNPTISPEEFINGVDYELNRTEFLGDAYPFLNMMCSGPGIVAAFLGADVILNNGNIWFQPKEALPINKLHFVYCDNNYWLNRTKAVLIEANKRWGNSVIVGMPDLGGVFDILATFRGSQNLLLDLYDSPNEVIRVVNEIKELWHRYYSELSEFTTPDFYTNWSGILSETYTYMLQCDLCYMFSTDMFNQFVKDELRETCEFLGRGCYHLDGVGQIPHLESLMEINKMKLIQWVPGDGSYDSNDWLGVNSKVISAGKHLQIMDYDFSQLDKLISHFGRGKNVAVYQVNLPANQRARAFDILSRYNFY